MKLVSVIITTHKGKQYIKRAVESVINQTYNNLEIIVVDDNGIGTREQIKTEKVLYEYITSRAIKYICHKVNMNGAVARNTGFKQSNGELIAFLDDDDMYLPNKIKSQVNVINKLNDGWGMVYCSLITHNPNNTYSLHKAKKSGNLLYELMLHSVIIGTDTLLVKRNIYEKVNGFDESFLRHQDYEFTACVAAICKIHAVDEPGVIYSREVKRNSPKNIEKAQEYRIHYLNKMSKLFTSLPEEKIRMVVLQNVLEVTLAYLRRGQVKKFIKSFHELYYNWCKKIKIYDIARVMYFKMNRKVTSKTKIKSNYKNKLDELYEGSVNE